MAAILGTESTGNVQNLEEQPTKSGWAFTSPILALAFVPLFVNWTSASRAHQTDTRDFAKDLLDSVEPYGVLVTVGDNDTFPLWYAQEVEGIRKDVVVANTSLLNTDWYTRQMLRRPAYDYDSLAGPAVYRGHAWPKPTAPVMQLTLAQADAVPLTYELASPQVIRKTGTDLVATVDPKNLAHGVLERADVFVLHLILDNNGRSVYLSSTSGNYGQQLGVGQYLLTQGLARKVLTSAPVATKDTINLAGEGWVDLKRSMALWDAFEAPAAFIRRGQWVDKASVNIPALYVMSGYFLAEALGQAGDKAQADSVMRTATEVAQASSLGDLFRPQLPQMQALPPAESGDAPRAAVPLPGPARPSAPPSPAPGAPARPPTR
jgi:hypothetical protein